MTKHDIYDELEGFQLWNYMECEKDEDGRELGAKLLSERG